MVITMKFFCNLTYETYTVYHPLIRRSHHIDHVYVKKTTDNAFKAFFIFPSTNIQCNTAE